MIVAMARDPRVLVIKLADRLHNMRTLRFLPPEKQEKKARETLEILAPLAHRLGMNTIKWELEDLAFATLYPKRYDEIVRLVAERAPSRDTYLAEVDRRGHRAAEGGQDRGGRHRPAQALLLDLPEDDRPRPRLHRHLGPGRHPDPGRLGARLLRGAGHHARPLAAGARPLQGLRGDAEVQHVPVAAHDGDRPAGQAGRAADPHPRHAPHRRVRHRRALEVQGEGAGGGKTEAGGSARRSAADDMLWLRQLLDWQREAQEPGEFLETLRYDLGPQEVFVFTPKGDVISLPADSTPVDFAYAVHTEVGHRCIGARVNGTLVSLDSKLTNGDVVEVFTSRSPTAGPSQDWLQFVGSSRARTKIRQWFTKERREDAVEAGKEALTRAMRKAGLPLQRLLGGEALTTLATDLRYADVTALYAAVGENQVSAHSLVEKLLTALGGAEGAVEDIAETAIPTKRSVPRRAAGGDPGVVVHGMTDVWAKLAKCCTPVPGDDILGFVTRGGGCQRAPHRLHQRRDLQRKPERLVEVDWASAAGLGVPGRHPGRGAGPAPAALRRHPALADERVNILSASVQTSRDRVAISRFTFELADPAHLGRRAPDGAQRRGRLRRRARHRLAR